MSQDVIWDHFQNEGVAAFSGARPRLEFLIRRLRRNERVLNIGVGSGDLEALVVRKGIEVWALDPSERAIAQLRERLGLGEHARVGYGQKMPFPDENFDALIMTEVLEHLEDVVRENSLLEAARVLKSEAVSSVRYRRASGSKRIRKSFVRNVNTIFTDGATRRVSTSIQCVRYLNAIFVWKPWRSASSTNGNPLDQDVSRLAL